MVIARAAIVAWLALPIASSTLGQTSVTASQAARPDLRGIVASADGTPLKDATVIISTAAVRHGTSPY